MDYLRIIVLGIVQGVTEFLPISSDGHLVVASRLFAVVSGQSLGKEDVVETIVLHLGTLAAILVVYWREILRLLGDDRRVIGLLVVGTLPAAASGLLLKNYASEWLVDPLLTGCMLPLNGLLLLWIGRRGPGSLAYADLSYPQALLIGLWQAAAPLPGISRSGTTIVGGLLVGLRRESAATFSFLLAIPAISGAGVLALVDWLHGETTELSRGALLTGTLLSFVVGVAALRLFLALLGRGRLNVFAWWCIALGAAMVVWQAA